MWGRVREGGPPFRQRHFGMPSKSISYPPSERSQRVKDQGCPQMPCKPLLYSPRGTTGRRVRRFIRTGDRETRRVSTGFPPPGKEILGRPHDQGSLTGTLGGVERNFNANSADFSGGDYDFMGAAPASPSRGGRRAGESGGKPPHIHFSHCPSESDRLDK